jgi:integrase
MNEPTWEKFKSHLQNEGLSTGRIEKLKSMFVTLERGLPGKNLETVTRQDIEELANRLNRNEFKKLDGKNMSGPTKVDLKKFIKQFYKWLKGNNEFYPSEVSWLKTKLPKHEKPTPKNTINEDQCKQLAESFSHPEWRALIYLLFDSGFRIQEMLSVKKKDLTFESYEGTEKCFFLKCNLSKTVIRKIDIPIFTKELEHFLNSGYWANKKDNDLLFDFESDSVRIMIQRKAQKLFNMKLTPHCFRHSSATLYAVLYEGNIFDLMHRFGWTDMRQAMVYVRTSGTINIKSTKKIYNNQASKLNGEVTELKAQLSKMQDSLAQYKQVLSPELLKTLKQIKSVDVTHWSKEQEQKYHDECLKQDPTEFDEFKKH